MKKSDAIKMIKSAKRVKLYIGLTKVNDEDYEIDYYGASLTITKKQAIEFINQVTEQDETYLVDEEHYKRVRFINEDTLLIN